MFFLEERVETGRGPRPVPTWGGGSLPLQNGGIAGNGFTDKKLILEGLKKG